MPFQEITQTNVLKVPPQDLDSEKSVLGSIMIDADAMNIVSDILGVGDFYSHKHNLIYETILHLYQKKGTYRYTFCFFAVERKKTN